MAILSKQEAKMILQKVIAFSEADGIEASITGSDNGNIRFARNSVSTSGETSNVTLAVKSNYGKKSGTATVNEFDDASLEKAVRRSEELAKLAPENPEFMDALPPQKYLESHTWFAETAQITPAFRAQAVATGMGSAAAQDVTVAGYLEDISRFDALMNHKNLFAYNQATNVDFTATMRTNDGTGSGWVKRTFSDVSRLDTVEASETAIKKAVMSRNPKTIEPGKYTVILEPAAAEDLIWVMLSNMDAREADEGRNFLSKKGGGTKLGEKIVDERVNIYSDAQHPEAPESPWADDGFARKKVDLIRGGVLKNLMYDRYWASQKNVEPVPAPANQIMDGGSTSLEEMIKDTKKGILVTRFWYVRSVDPQTLLYTGLTRDGTFYIENGAIKHSVKNFRFNESPVTMLNNLEALGKQVRIYNSLIPYMKIRDFTFTSLSDAV